MTPYGFLRTMGACDEKVREYRGLSLLQAWRKVLRGTRTGYDYRWLVGQLDLEPLCNCTWSLWSGHQPACAAVAWRCAGIKDIRRLKALVPPAAVRAALPQVIREELTRERLSSRGPGR
jgi:hypothetical protein